MKAKNALHIQWIQTAAWLPSLVGLALAAASARPALAEPGNDNRAPEVPQEIAVGATNKVHFHGYAVGVQIYTWDGSSWGPATPSATLFDEDGNIVASHFAGPTWKSNSGSEVVGALPPKSVTPDDTAIAWLLLKAVDERTHGPGIFANTTYIHRVNTVGGKAPQTSGTTVGQVAAVPYTADYFFYRQANE